MCGDYCTTCTCRLCAWRGVSTASTASVMKSLTDRQTDRHMRSLCPRAPTFLFSSWGKGRTPPLPLSLLSSSSLLCRPLPVGIGALNTASGPGTRCKLPQWSLVRSPSRQTIWSILESKSAALMTAVFVDFSENKCNFLHKNNLGPITILVTGRRAMRSFFSCGSRPPPLPYGSLQRVWPRLVTATPWPFSAR